MPVRKGPPSVEGTLGTQEERLRALEIHQHDKSLVGTGGSGGKEYATIVIAAFDTHPSGANTADVRCSGGADGETISQAIMTLPKYAAGLPTGRVVLLEGNYILDDHEIVLGDNYSIYGVDLVGMGQGTMLRSTAGYTAIQVGGDACSVRDLAIFSNGGRHGIVVNEGFETRIAKVDITGADTGFLISDSDVSLDTCNAYSCLVGFSGDTRTYCLNCSVIGGSGYQLGGFAGTLVSCDARGCDDPAIALAGIDCEALACRIQGGNVGMNGIAVSGNGASLIGNVISAPPSHGIVLAADSATVLGNHIRDAGGDGIRLSDADANNIQMNIIRNCTGDEINVFDAACNDNLVTNNDLLGGTFNDTGTGTITTAGNRL